jgi:hypothetical protein
MSYFLLISARTGRAALPGSVEVELRMILSEKSATPAFAGAGIFGIMR